MDMRHLKTLSTCLAALALHSAAWAEIYETTDAQGNPEFTDSPTGPSAEAIDLQQTNIIDAPPEEPQQVSAPQTVVDEQAPEQENRTAIIHDGNGNEDEVSDSQMPREVGDSDSQVPDEVGDFDSPTPDAVSDTDVQIVHEADDSHINRRVVHPHRR
jgi:hypothetical protein